MPRYYDPVREEIKERTEAIRKQLNSTDTEFIRSNISEAFARRSKEYSKGNSMQLVFVITLIAVLVGYVFYGNVALLSFLIILPVYILLKLRKNL